LADLGWDKGKAHKPFLGGVDLNNFGVLGTLHHILLPHGIHQNLEPKDLAKGMPAIYNKQQALTGQTMPKYAKVGKLRI